MSQLAHCTFCGRTILDGRSVVSTLVVGDYCSTKCVDAQYVTMNLPQVTPTLTQKE